MDAYIPYTKTQRGYIPLYGHLSYEPSSAPETTPLIDEVKLKYAEKFIDLAKENNIQIVFTASPKYGMGSDNYFAPIAAICAKKNVPFWNYYVSTEFSRERSLFEDPVHMNDKGAREFSAVVAHQIKTELNYK
jgi:lysophospholipase L1-like esterase